MVGIVQIFFSPFSSLVLFLDLLPVLRDCFLLWERSENGRTKDFLVLVDGGGTEPGTYGS